MAMFKAVATEQLKFLFLLFVLANGLLAVPANPANNSCGSDLYLRLLKTHYCLVFLIFVSATLLLVVRMVVDNAEAGAVTAARAARGEAFDADKEAAAAAARGIANVPAGWRRLSLRALLNLAVSFSSAASLEAFDAFEDGFRYRTGCQAEHGAGSRSPFVACILMFLVVVVNGLSGRVADYQN